MKDDEFIFCKLCVTDLVKSLADKDTDLFMHALDELCRVFDIDLDVDLDIEISD